MRDIHNVTHAVSADTFYIYMHRIHSIPHLVTILYEITITTCTLFVIYPVLPARRYASAVLAVVVCPSVQKQLL